MPLAIKSASTSLVRVRNTETGLHYNWFRYYEPAQGRYLQSDPLGIEAGTNSFSYVGQNPITHADPLGLKEDCCDKGDAEAWQECAMKAGLRYRACLKIAWQIDPYCTRFCWIARRLNPAAGAACDKVCKDAFNDAISICRRALSKFLRECDNAFFCVDEPIS